MIKLSNSLKQVLTEIETVLAVLFNAAMVVVPIVTNSLSPLNAVKYASIVNAALLIAKAGQKGLTALGAATGTQPLQVAGQIESGIGTVAPDAEALAAEVVKQLNAGVSVQSVAVDAVSDLSEIEKVVSDVEEAASQPPADANVGTTPSATPQPNAPGA